MSRNSQAHRLALSVAVALSAGGGALFPVMPHAFAADVSGQNVTVDNPADPQLTASGISAGEINGWTDAGNVTNNTLTLSGVTYSGFGNVYGGFTAGTGNAAGNKLFLKNGASIGAGGWAIGGRTNNGGDATGNEIHIDDSGTGAGLYAIGGMTNGQTGNAAANKAFMTDGAASYLYGGFVFGANSTGNATGNELTLSGGTVNRDVAGGVIQGPSANSQGKGDVSGSTVTITGGTVSGTTYGGTTQGIGSVKTNKVTVSGTATVLHDVLGGRSMTGDASTNTLNFQGATADNLIGGRIAGTNAAGNAATNTVTVTSGTVNQDVRGGEIIAPSATGNVSGNIVNINGGTISGAVTAGYNMGTGKVDGGNTVNVAGGTITGVVTGGHGTQTGEVSGNKVDITGGTLSDSIRGGFAYDGKASANEVTITGGTLSGSTIMGGFSANGAASGNTATVGTVAFTGNIMGGSAATGADTNKVFLKDNAAISGNAYGGLVGNGGAVTGNELTIEATGATVSSDAVGGQNNAAAGDVTDNKAYMRGGSVTNQLIGGMVAGVGATGKASGNRAEVSGGSSAFIAGALISDTGATGEASDNHAVVSGASAALGSIYGGITNGTGAAKDNTATISGSITANDVVGGQSVTGNAEGNKVEFTQATVTNVRGARIIGSGAGSAINNEATIAGGTVTSAAGAEIVGASATGDVQDNTLTVTGGTVSGDSYGGITYGTGDAIHNGVVVSGSSTNLNDVYGGSSAGGNAKKNYVTYSEATAANLTGGRAQSGAGSVSDNKVEMTGGSVTNDVTGGLSYGSGTVEKNEVKISGGTVGGTILGGQNIGTGAASSNIVELTDGTINAAVYGGWANSGAADTNTVTVKKNVTGNVFGGNASGSASGNTVDLGAVTVTGNVTGGFGNTTSNNTVNMEGSTVGGVITVGSAGGTDNTLTVKGTNSAGNITGFQSAIFDLGSTVTSPNAMVNLTGGASTNIDWRTLGWIGMATGARTLLSNTNGFTISYYALNGTFVSETTTHEYFIDTDTHSDVGAKKINLDEYQFKGAVVSKSADPDADIWAGRSKHGNTTQDNELTITGSSTTKNAYGGWTSGTGTTNADKNDSMNNKVNLNGGTLADVYGGYTTSVGGKATGNTVNVAGGTAVNVVGGQSIGDATKNTVNVTANFMGNVTGGVSTTGAASRNIVNLGAVTVDGNVTGGQGVTTDDNVIHLNKTTVTGTITGGTASSGTGNTLVVHPGVSQAQSLAGLQNINFFLDDTHDKTVPILKLTTTGTQDLRGVGVGVGVIDGAHPVYRINEQFSLIKAPGGTIQTDATIRNTSSAMQGVSLRYEFDVAQTATNEVSAVVKKAKLTEQTKSLVETRAGATAFINQGTDFLVSNNIQAAKTAAAAEKAEHADGYALWAGLGASNMRAETGSYVESKGWNLGIGWAREHEMDAGKIVYGPFVSYGNGTYDSYLDDNTHGSGKFRTLGLGLMARVDQNNGMWFEGSLQGGRAKSDYSGVIYSGTNSEYDVSSTYWAGHFGVGKNIQLKENETINPYLRYFWSHQAGSNATLKNNGRAGESYEFSSVSSQRIRLGFQYTNRNAADGEFYAGLALEYEFDGSANASYQGYSTLRPSLKGSSGMLELGYRFAPKDGNVTYDFSLAGWQGKRRGLSGDLGVKWMF